MFLLLEQGQAVLLRRSHCNPLDKMLLSLIRRFFLVTNAAVTV
jgi:hypothetical protein